MCTDAELISILQQAWLLPKEGPIDPAVEAKFSLESSVGDEGAQSVASQRFVYLLSHGGVQRRV